MSLEIRKREREGIAILDVVGPITAGAASAKLRELIREVSTSGSSNVVLNLEEVEYIDSSGLGGLVVWFTSLRKQGGALKLLNLNRRNIELLVLTKLTTVFELFNDEQDAVNSFFPGREIKRFDILSFVEQEENN